MKRVTYKKCGVNIAKGEDFVSVIKRMFPSKQKQTVSAFGSLFALAPFLRTCKNPYLVSSSDGVGTKLLIAQKLGIHHTVGIDLVAMNTNDIVSIGARPLFFLDYIACGKMNTPVLTDVMRGIKKGLKDSDCALSGGETAEMPDMYKPGEYDLAGFAVGIVDKRDIVDGKNITSGDIVIGLASNGIHSNGYSLVRGVLGASQMKKYAREILAPTRIYVKPILSLLSAMSHKPQAVKGIAHVTGGAFYTKATKILPPPCRMVLDKSSWVVPEIFRRIQKKGNITEKEMYSVFNMGIGMIVVVKKDAVERSRAVIEKHCKTYVIGEIVKSSAKTNKVVWVKKS